MNEVLTYPLEQIIKKNRENLITGMYTFSNF